MRSTILAGLLAIAAAGAAHAGTIDTYSFTQGGYILDGMPGVLSGSFTGTVEADGYIQSADLSHFTDTLSFGGATAFGYGATFFSFSTTGGASTLDFPGPIGIGGTACVGAAAAFGLGGCAGGNIDGSAFGFVTTVQPTLTLVSSIVVHPQPQPRPMPTPAPQPQPTPAPEPASLALLGGALAAFGIVVSGRRPRGVA